MACAKYFAVERCFRPFCRRRFVSLSVHFVELLSQEKAEIREENVNAMSFGHFNAKASRREHPGCLFSCCFRIFSISLERFFPRLASSPRHASLRPFFFSRQITDGSRTTREKEEKSVKTLRSSLCDPE